MVAEVSTLSRVYYWQQTPIGRHESSESRMQLVRCVCSGLCLSSNLTCSAAHTPDELALDGGFILFVVLSPDPRLWSCKVCGRGNDGLRGVPLVPGPGDYSELDAL